MPARLSVLPPRLARTVAALLLVACPAAAVVAPGGPSRLSRAVVERYTSPVVTVTSAVAVGWGLLHGGRAERRDGVLMISGMSGGYGPRGGITIGRVFLTGIPGDRMTRARLRHEERHVRQWEALGPALPTLYLVAEAAGRVLRPGGGAEGNVFEIDAGLADGGYHRRPMPGWRSVLVRRLGPPPVLTECPAALPATGGSGAPPGASRRPGSHAERS